MDHARIVPLAGSHDWAGIIFGSLLLLWPALLNGYPLVYADTGNYLGQALLHFVGWNAPPFYSFFLLATDLRVSLWLSIFAQGLIASHLLSLVLRQFGWRGPWPILLICLLLASASSLPWFVSFLTPYVFAGVVVLSLWLLAFGEIGAWERRYLSLLAIGAVSVHFSHLPLAAGLALVGGVTAAAFAGARAGLRAFGRMALAPAAAAVMLMLVNLVAIGSAAVAPYGSVLVAAHMLYDGTARDYLRTACADRHYQICPYLDRIPDAANVERADENRNAFLFDHSVLNENLGGAKAWAPEAKAIVLGTVAHAPFNVATAALANSMRLFGHLALGGALRPWPDTPGPRRLIADYFPASELAAFGASAQAQGRLQDEAAVATPLQVALAWAGMAGLLVLLYVERRQRAAWTLCLLVGAAILGNALITAGLSGLEDHYEARVIWLAVFVPATLLARRLVPARQGPSRAARSQRPADSVRSHPLHP